MRLEDQVTSLALSQRLKELGVKQDSYFYWVHRPARKKRGAFLGSEESWNIENLRPSWSKDFVKSLEPRKNNSFRRWVESFEFYSAFTVAELGEMLPEEIGDSRLSIYKDDRPGFIKWEVSYSPVSERSIACVSDNSEANARGLTLAYLLDNHLLTTKDVGGGELTL